MLGVDIGRIGYGVTTWVSLFRSIVPFAHDAASILWLESSHSLSTLLRSQWSRAQPTYGWLTAACVFTVSRFMIHPPPHANDRELPTWPSWILESCILRRWQPGIWNKTAVVSILIHDVGLIPFTAILHGPSRCLPCSGAGRVQPFAASRLLGHFGFIINSEGTCNARRLT